MAHCLFSPLFWKKIQGLDGAPDPDGVLRESAKTTIRHYRQLYINRPDPIAFMSVPVDTSGRIYDDFSRLLFLHTHWEASALANELQEESEQFRFLRTACYTNIKGSVWLISAKASAMRISIPLDLSSRPFIPLPRFMRSRRVAPLLAPSLVFTPRWFVMEDFSKAPGDKDLSKMKAQYEMFVDAVDSK